MSSPRKRRGAGRVTLSAVAQERHGPKTSVSLFPFTSDRTPPSLSVKYRGGTVPSAIDTVKDLRVLISDTVDNNPVITRMTLVGGPINDALDLGYSKLADGWQPEVPRMFPTLEPGQEYTLKVDAVSANLLIAAALVIATAGFIFFGWLSDRIGRKPVMVAALFAAALCTLGWLLYRRLWLPALVYACTVEGLVLLWFAALRPWLQPPLPIEAGLGLALLVLSCALPGLWGDALVYTDIRKRTLRALDAAPNVAQAHTALAQVAPTLPRLYALAGLYVALGAALLGAALWVPRPSHEVTTSVAHAGTATVLPRTPASAPAPEPLAVASASVAAASDAPPPPPPAEVPPLPAPPPAAAPAAPRAPAAATAAPAAHAAEPVDSKAHRPTAKPPAKATESATATKTSAKKAAGKPTQASSAPAANTTNAVRVLITPARMRWAVASSRTTSRRRSSWAMNSSCALR